MATGDKKQVVMAADRAVANGIATLGADAKLNDSQIPMQKIMAVANAAEYSEADTYAVGAYCTKGGKLYRCKVAISTAEAWNAAHWEETTVGAELIAISIALANKVNNDRPMMLPFSLLNGYSAQYNCSYYRNALGDVTLELCFSGPITTSWTDVGILPEGYRPSSSLYIPAVASPGGGNGFFAIGAYVGANGYVKVRSPNDYSDVEITINTSFLAL